MPFNSIQETGRPVKIKDEGLTIVSNVSSIDFTGAGVSGSAIGADATEDIPNTGGGTWGSITGDITNQTDLQTALDAKGIGDMLLGTAQSVTGTKTFTKDKLLVKGTSTGTTNITTANTSATSYTATLPAKDGTVAMTSDIVSQVEDSITDGHTTIAPSGNAVFDALALKSPLASPAFTGTPSFGDANSTIEYTTDHMSINKGAGAGLYLFEGATTGERPEFRIYGFADSDGAGVLHYLSISLDTYGNTVFNNSPIIHNSVVRISAGEGLVLGQYDADNIAVHLGQEADASIYYDGTDFCIDTALVGTGVLKLVNATNWTANGTANVTISNVAPAGVGTATISKWFTVKDNNGVVYYIPAWT